LVGSKVGLGAGPEQGYRAVGFGKCQLKPLRLERYMANKEPQFEEKAADIIGLQLNAP
jgi:hypothetical protein